MSLTTDDKQYISQTIQQALDSESTGLKKVIVTKTDRLEDMIISETGRLENMIINKTDRLENMIINKTDRLEKMVVSESLRLEILMEDHRNDTTKILELLTDHLATNTTVKAHSDRLNHLEQTENLVLTTLNVHSREINKLGGSTV